MWRDIILILGFAFATFAYFGLTPRQIAKYARTTSAEISKRSSYQKVWLLIEVAISIVTIGMIIWTLGFTAFSLLTRLELVILYIVMAIICWVTMFDDIWKLSEKGRKITYNLMKYVVVPLGAVALIINWFVQESLLSKVEPFIGMVIGYGLGQLWVYLKKKFKRNHPSKDK